LRLSTTLTRVSSSERNKPRSSEEKISCPAELIVHTAHTTDRGQVLSMERRFEHLDFVQEAVLILNTGREIVFGNRAASVRFGDHTLGQDIVHLTRNPQFIELINAALTSREMMQRTIVFGEPANGTFDVRVSPFRDSFLDKYLLLVSFRDINEVLLAQEMRSDFVANVSHELRSPLSTISGFIETLKGPAKDDAKARTRFLDLMEHEAERMVRLIADLLSLSKVQANKRTTPHALVDIVAIAKQVENSLENQASDQGKSIDLIISEEIDEIAGSADELTQVLRNLLENALKYSGEDTTVTITLSKQDRVAGITGPAVAITVKDRGEGIAPQHLSRLTERFYRVDSHRSRSKGGTGLGLAIVKHIVLRHRGRLKIDSELGEGSTFTVYLPSLAANP